MSAPATGGIQGVNYIYDANTDATYLIGFTGPIGILSVTGVSGSTGLISNVAASSLGGSMNIFGITGASAVYVVPATLKAVRFDICGGGGGVADITSPGAGTNAYIGGGGAGSFASLYYASPQTQISPYLSLTIGAPGGRGGSGSASIIRTSTGATVVWCFPGVGCSAPKTTGATLNGLVRGAFGGIVPRFYASAASPSFSIALAGGQGGAGMAMSDGSALGGMGGQCPGSMSSMAPQPTRDASGISGEGFGWGSGGDAILGGVITGNTGGTGVCYVYEYY